MLVAKRCESFDDFTSERPFAVVLDIHDENGNYFDQGTDWNYFETEDKADKFIETYNKVK